MDAQIFKHVPWLYNFDLATLLPGSHDYAHEQSPQALKCDSWAKCTQVLH